MTTFILPGLAILMLRTSNTISSVTLFERKGEALPFIIITMVYAIIAFMFGYQRTFNTLITAVVIGMAVISFLLTLITFYFKISVHAATIAGVVGFTLGTHQHFPTEGNFLICISVLIILAGLVTSSRLALGAHRPIEIMSGILVGFFVSLFQYTFSSKS